MAKRRGNGEGSVYRKENGAWCAVLTVGFDTNGKRRRRYLYGRTKAEVLDKLSRNRADSLNGLVTDSSRLSVAAYLKRWLEDDARPTIRETTLLSYRSVVSNHINPHIGGLGLSKLSPNHIQSLQGTLEREGASPRMRQLVHAVLSRALSRAVRFGLLVRNPCDAVDRPRVPRREMAVLNPDQVQMLLKAASGDPLEALYVTAIGTGARLGELLGLRWEDIDFRSGSVSIQRTLVDINGKLTTSEPKSARSRRRIDLPGFVITALRNHRNRQAAQPHPKAWVFSDRNGGPLRKNNLLRRSFRPLLTKAKLPKIRFHDLRHTAATLLLAQGIHPKVVQERLGHATVAITLDIYSHVLPSMQREAADSLDAIVGGHAS